MAHDSEDMGGEIKITKKGKAISFVTDLRTVVAIMGFVISGVVAWTNLLPKITRVEVSSPEIEQMVKTAIEPVRETMQAHVAEPFPAHTGGEAVMQRIDSGLADVRTSITEFKATEAQKDVATERKFEAFASEQRRTNEKLDQLIGATQAIRDRTGNRPDVN